MSSMPCAYRNVNGILDIFGIICHDATMSEDKDPRIITPMPSSMVKSIDDFRFGQRMPSRAEAIRRLIEIGLEAVKHQGPEK